MFGNTPDPSLQHCTRFTPGQAQRRESVVLSLEVISSWPLTEQQCELAVSSAQVHRCVGHFHDKYYGTLSATSKLQ